MVPKPAWPLGVSAPLPGLKVFWPICELAGPIRDARQGRSSPFNMAVTGTPAYSSGRLGRQVGGFTTANYFGVDRPAGLGALSAFPMLLAAVVTIPSGNTTFGYALCCDDATGASLQGLAVNNVSGRASYRYKVTGGSINSTEPLAGVGPAINDGLPHVVVGRSLDATTHELWVDGVLTATGAISTLIIGSVQHSIGVTRTGGVVASPFPGTVQGAMLGTGGLLDPVALARDFFASIRPRSGSRAVLTTAPTAVVKVPRPLFVSPLGAF